MYRYKCIISYDGTNFMGFQIQDNLRTVELEIKNALFKLTNEDRDYVYIRVRNEKTDSIDFEYIEEPLFLVV